MRFKVTLKPESRDWVLLAGFGLLVPALIAVLRVRMLRHSILGALGMGLVPLHGSIAGFEPQIFTRLMHNLTHPLILMTYSMVFAVLPFHLRKINLAAWRGAALICATDLLHITYFASYCVSLLLPVGDLVANIRA